MDWTTYWILLAQILIAIILFVIPIHTLVYAIAAAIMNARRQNRGSSEKVM